MTECKLLTVSKSYLKTQISFPLHQTSLAKDIKLLGGICGLETYGIWDFCVLDPQKMVFYMSKPCLDAVVLDPSNTHFSKMRKTILSLINWKIDLTEL